MREHLPLLAAFACGLLMGTVFFGGLWLTVRFAIASSAVALWFMASLVARTGIALGGFYLVAHDGWRGLMSCLLGFVTARLVVTWLTRGTTTVAGSGAEARHAS